MKTLCLALVSVLSISALSVVSSIASAQRPQVPPGSVPGRDQIPPHIPDFPHTPDFPDNRGGDDHDPRGGSSCAPDVVEGNVAITDRTLTTLAASPAFASAATFRSLVSEIVAVRRADTRVAHYFALIGINSRNSSAVASFVGSRSVDPRWVSALERSTGLSGAQASVVASDLQAALRGNLQ